jgi:hypothetical protein
MANHVSPVKAAAAAPQITPKQLSFAQIEQVATVFEQFKEFRDKLTGSHLSHKDKEAILRAQFQKIEPITLLKTLLESPKHFRAIIPLIILGIQLNHLGRQPVSTFLRKTLETGLSRDNQEDWIKTLQQLVKLSQEAGIPLSRRAEDGKTPLALLEQLTAGIDLDQRIEQHLTPSDVECFGENIAKLCLKQCNERPSEQQLQEILKGLQDTLQGVAEVNESRFFKLGREAGLAILEDREVPKEQYKLIQQAIEEALRYPQAERPLPQPSKKELMRIQAEQFAAQAKNTLKQKGALLRGELQLFAAKGKGLLTDLRRLVQQDEQKEAE